MEKVLKLYNYVDGVKDTPFPNKDEQVIVSSFRYDAKRMGGSPTISCTVNHFSCLDKLWNEKVYAILNGERFFIKQVPTSSFSNSDARYKHELELVSERIILDNVYFYDVVSSDVENDKPVSNSSNFSFFGTIEEFAQRLNYSLEYSGVDYKVIIDEGVSSEGKMVSFQDQFFINAIQEIYNTYNLPYYFVGNEIHIGYTNNALTEVFKYGVDESLLSIQKQNANYKIVNRVTGVGSADNIPYYYPNDYESKEEVEANGGVWINPQTNLMPSIYRETLGKERFYNALNNTYKIPESEEYYEFANPFVDGKPKEHIVNFDDIKPTIKGITNADGFRIDMFSEFAFDENDNDETKIVDGEEVYAHPYFFAKLRKFDGQFGFNLFDHAIDEGEKTISMTSGSCGACEFIIGVDENTQKNLVQVDEYGDLLRDSNGNVRCGRKGMQKETPQDVQNDTENNEVWIALKKDIQTFRVIMPNATHNYNPSVNDTFVILHIDLPKAYILAAEDNLKNQLIEYMALNNSEKFNFSISFSRIFFEENPDILESLNENARLQIEYDGETYTLYVSSFSYTMSNDQPLPEIRVELSDTITVTQNALQTAINAVKNDIVSNFGNIDLLGKGLKYFLRKDRDDRSKGKISSDKAFEIGNFVSGASGAIIQVDKNTGQTIAELDKLYVRMKAYFETLEIINVNSIGGKQILSPAGSIKCIGVEELENSYRCYFLAEQDGEEVENRFQKNMQAYSQTFNAKEGENNQISNKYYWRLIVKSSSEPVMFEKKKCHYIDLSKTDCDEDSDTPSVGDIINHRGSRTDTDYMNFIETSSVGTNAPYITLFQGVNSYSLEGKDYVSFGYDQSTGKAYMNVYGDMYVGDRNQTSYMRYTQDGGLELCGKLAVGTKLGDKDLQDLIDSASPEGYEDFVDKVTRDIEGLQNQIDGAIESYFYQYEPSLTNYPASDWDTESEKKAHLNDTFTNLVDGRSWRWTVDDKGVYSWTEITDTATSEALALAGKAQDTADGKRRVFTDTPFTPYDKGDLWAGGSESPLMLCINSRKSGDYVVDDWDYADNTEKIRAEIQTTKDDLNNEIGKAKEAANKYADDGIAEANAALEKSIKALDEAKAEVDSVYTKSEANGIISKAEKDAIDAAKKQAEAAIALSQITIKAYADGVVSEEEKERIKQAEENLVAAKAYADEKVKEAFDKIGTFDYLKAALKEDTTIKGGLIQSSLLQLGYTDISGKHVVMSGTNGVYNADSHGGGVSSWWGGGLHDLFDYYSWNGQKWVAKPNVTIPANLPSGLIRFDGTGYFAKGNFWWDADGKLYADPTTLFLLFDVENEAESLSKTILALRDKQTEFEAMWNVKQDANGNKYLLTSYPLVTQGGVTMYADTTNIDVEGIYDGLPIDGTTIYWENGVLKAVSDGGVADSVLWENVEGAPTNVSYFTNDSGYITGVTSQMVITALGFTPYDASKFTKANIKSTLGISDWALYSSKPSYKFSEIKEAPTTIGGYGITDASIADGVVTLGANTITPLTKHQTIYTLGLKINGVSKSTFTPTSKAATFEISVPTKVSDLENDSEFTTKSDVDTRISNLINGAPEAYDTLKEIADVLAGNVDSIGDILTALETKASKSTTLSGYGITDAKISDGVITLGENTITPLTEHQTIYNLTMQAGMFTSVTFDPNGAAKTVKIPTTTSHISEGTNLYFTNARAVSALTKTLKAYVTKADTQTITGEKDFTGGLKVNGSTVTYNSTDKYWKLEGDLVVTGGVTMYANDTEFTPSTIMDAIATDNTNLKVVNGVLTFVGSIDGGEAGSVAWANVTGKPAWIGSSKPSYAYTEITGTPDLSVYALKTSLSSYQPLITSTNKLAYSLISGTPTIPTALKNPKALTFGGKTYDGSVAATITAADLGALTSHQSLDGYVNAITTTGTGNAITSASKSGKTITFTKGSTFLTSHQAIYSLTVNSGDTSVVTYTPKTASKTLSFVAGSNVTLTADATNGKITIASSYTNTKNTAGSTDTSSKIFLIGATSQTANPKTYSHDTAYVGTDGCLYSGGSKVLTSHQTIYTLGINNSAGVAQLSYTPNSKAATLTLTKAMVGLGNVENTALSAWAGSSKITTLGTITSGTWNGTKIANAYLANSSVTISGTSISLGGSITQAKLRTALGLGSNAYTSTPHLPLAGGTLNNTLYFAKNSTVTHIMSNEVLVMGSEGERLIALGVVGETQALYPVQAKSEMLDLGTSTNYWKNLYLSGNICASNIVIGSTNITDNIVPLNVTGKGWFSGGIKLNIDANSYNNSGITFSSAVGGGIVGILGMNGDGVLGLYPNERCEIRPNSDGTSLYGIDVQKNGNLEVTYNQLKSGIHLIQKSANEAFIRYSPNNQTLKTWIVGSDMAYNYTCTYASDGTNYTYKFIVYNDGTAKAVNGFNLNASNGDVGYKQDGIVMLRNNGAANGGVTIVSGTSSVFLRPNGTTATKGQVMINYSGVVQINSAPVYDVTLPSIAMNFSEFVSFGGYHALRGENQAIVLCAPTGSTGTVILRPNGNMANSTQTTIDSSGNMLVNGGITMYSDKRKKTILKDVELSLKEIANAPLIEHYYNNDNKRTSHVGSIAQYWAGLNDWFCKLDNEGYYTMEIQNAALASAISIARELDRYENKTDKQIKKLKKRINELEEEIEHLKAN